MRPLDVQQIGEELAVKWADGSESFVLLEKLRRHCPCAGCRGEKDILGNIYKDPPRPLAPQAFHLRAITRVGAKFHVCPAAGVGGNRNPVRRKEAGGALEDVLLAGHAGPANHAVLTL